MRRRAPVSLLAFALGVSLLWLVSLVVAPVVRAHPDRWPSAVRASAGLTYVAGSFICHQRPERSFHVGDAPLPVCARCTGLHAGVALGLLGLLVTSTMWRARLREASRAWRVRAALAVVSLPTILSVALEQLGAGSPPLARALAASPLGAGIALLVGTAIEGWLVERGAARRPAAGQGSATLP
jgi:uncharacterized membrane protein